MQTATEFLGTMRKHHAPSECHLIDTAFEIAAEAHDGQTRKSGDPYLVHPIAVALLPGELLRLHDWRFVAVGLLHDVVEDCSGFDQRRIVTSLGPEILASVLVLTKDSKRKHEFLRQIRHQGGVLEWIIKLCDKIHNLSTIEFLAAADARRIVANARRDYLPLARDLAGRLETREKWWSGVLHAEIARLCREHERRERQRGDTRDGL